MWRLLEVSTGKSAGVAFWDKWEACKQSYHEDGKPYNYREAMSLEEGAIVYRRIRTKQFIKLPVIENGRVVDEQTRTSTGYDYAPYTLVKA